MYSSNSNIYDAYFDSIQLFENRMRKHNEDKLFITNYGKYLSEELEKKSINRIKEWKDIIFNNNFNGCEEYFYSQY